MSDGIGTRLYAQRLAAVQVRLQRIAAGDLVALVEPQTLVEIHQLTELLPDDGSHLEARYALGWLHWHRYKELAGREQLAERASAETWFTPCFLAGIDSLPEEVLPRLAEATMLIAHRWLEEALASAEPGLISMVVGLWQRIRRATPDDHPARGVILSDLGHALWGRYEQNGRQEDLNEAIAVGREAVKATAGDNPAIAVRLFDLWSRLWNRHERTGRQDDLDEAVTVGREVVEAAPDDHPDRAQYLFVLGMTLQAQYERTENQEDLDEAVTVSREAIKVAPEHHPSRAGFLSHLGLVLQARYERAGRQEDLDEAVTVGHTAVKATAANSFRAGELTNLGLTLRTRYERTGNQEDLDEAITVGREAVEATSNDHGDPAGPLSNLGGALHRRYERTGRRADLDEAITVSRAAVEATPSGDPDRAARLSNLGASLHARYERTGNHEDLDKAIAKGREAVAASPDDAGRAMHLSNLAASLHTRYELTRREADLDEGVTASREAVNATPDHHLARAGRLSNLGGVLQRRYERTRSQNDLDKAITAGREAVEVSPDGHPDRAEYLFNLGGALARRYQLTSSREDLKASSDAYTGAWKTVSAVPTVRIRAARAAATLLAPREAGLTRAAELSEAEQAELEKAADLLEGAVLLLGETAPRQLNRSDQQHALGTFAGLAGDACALALSSTRDTKEERAARALGLLEAGRAVLMSQALDTRSDLTDLREQHPRLAARYELLRDQLYRAADDAARVAIPTRSGGLLPGGQQPVVPDPKRPADEFTALLAEIRTHEGLEAFGRPPTTQELLTEAEQGPVVVFNVSPYRSDALLLTQTGIRSVDLERLDFQTLTKQIDSFRQALHSATDTEQSDEQQREAQPTLTRILEWLWDVAAGPVLTALGFNRQPAETSWPRVWWAPGGWLGLLPVHAAGYHTDPAEAPERRTVLDRVVSSYTPTVRALRYARERTSAPASPSRALVAAMPTTPHLPDDGRLRFVPREINKVLGHLPNSTLLREPAPGTDPSEAAWPVPTKAEVLTHLPTCPITHFACHGASHPTDPSKSLLLLHDHDTDPLTVVSLAPFVFDQAQLAYLSACRTATIDTTELIDESIHLTAAFQLTGFPHVIGTLWEIDDLTAVTVADLFYTHLRSGEHTLDASRASNALHHAIRAVRDGRSLQGTPSLWAAYLHAGA
jgi:tetratricopeptide (TPR) repeat protein